MWLKLLWQELNDNLNRNDVLRCDEPSVKERPDKLSWPLFLACRKIVCNETEEASAEETRPATYCCLRLPCISSKNNISSLLFNSRRCLRP